MKNDTTWEVISIGLANMNTKLLSIEQDYGTINEEDLWFKLSAGEGWGG